MRLKYILLFLVCTTIIENGNAQQANDSIMDLGLNKKAQFRISPFFWYLGLKGKIIKPPEPSNLPEYDAVYSI